MGPLLCPALVQAWMRARGQSGMKTFTTDDVVDQFGVVKGTYEAVPLPKIKAYTVRGGVRLDSIT